MKPIGKKKFFIVLLLLGVTLIISGPTCLSQGVGVTKITGGTVQLIASSINQYNSGVTLTNWSKVKLTCTGLNIGQDWVLKIGASDRILSDDGNLPLDLSLLKLIPVNPAFDSDATSCSTNAGYELTELGQVFLSGTTKLANFEITFGITYELGKDVSLLGTSPGYYYIPYLWFQLE